MHSAYTPPPFYYTALFIGIAGAVEANLKGGGKICFHHLYRPETGCIFLFLLVFLPQVHTSLQRITCISLHIHLYSSVFVPLFVLFSPIVC